MITDFIITMQRVLGMSFEEKKARLVQIRKNQLITEALTNSDDMPASAELEAAFIINTIGLPMDEFMALRAEIDRLAHLK